MAKKSKDQAAAAAAELNAKLAASQQENKVENQIETVEDQARPVIKAEDVYSLSTEAIEAAIADGFIRWNGGTPESAGTRESSVTDVTITKDKSPTKKDEDQPYEKLEALTFEGMVLLSGGKAEPAVLRGDAKVDPRKAEERVKGAPDFFNYGLDLEVKRNLRKVLEQSISGPEKGIMKMAKVLFELKMAKSMDAAIAQARAQYEANLAAQAEPDTE